MRINYKLLAGVAMALAVGTGCKKSYLDTAPTNAVDETHVFETTQSAYIALNGIHGFLSSASLFNGEHDNFGIKAMDLESDKMGEDMLSDGNNYDWFSIGYDYTWTESATYRLPYNMWIFYYRIINNANKILDHIDAAEGPQSEKDDIKGQALAYRAFSYMRLCEWYQQSYFGPNDVDNSSLPGVPLYLHASTPDVTAPRGTLKQNYDQIRADLTESISLLQNAPFHAQKSNISLAVAQGLASRFYLLTHEWQKVIDNAVAARAAYPIMAPAEYTTGFNSADNAEWMWSSTLTDAQYHDQGIVCFISFMDPNTGGYASVAPTKIARFIYNDMSATDVRKQNFTAQGNQLKFRTQVDGDVVFDNLYMRSSEMYLNEIEALAYSHQDGPARDALISFVTKRDPNYTVPGNISHDDLVTEIQLQRRIELWGEGFARNDIMRWNTGLHRPTGAGNHIASVAKVLDLPAGSPRFLLKIPQREIDANPNINGGDQNP